MPGITCSFVSVCQKGDLLAEVADLKAVNPVLMIGPRDECVKLCESMEAAAAHSRNKAEAKKVIVRHTESFAALTDDNTGRDEAPVHFVYVVILVHEGEKAMLEAEKELLTIDPRYLVKPSVDIVNWRTDGRTSQGLTTPIMDIIKLSSRFNVVVHSVCGNTEESVHNLGLKMCSRVQHIVAHPHVPT